MADDFPIEYPDKKQGFSKKDYLKKAALFALAVLIILLYLTARMRM